MAQQQLVRVIRNKGVGWLFAHAWGLVNARIQLRTCNKLGTGVTLNGRAKVRNKGYISIGNRAFLNGDTVRLELYIYPGGRLEIGEGTGVDYGTTFLSQHAITVGRNCLIAAYCRIMDSDFHQIGDKSWSFSGEPVKIGDRVWLGPNVTVLKGVTIGDDAIITANSLVTRDVPPRTIATGVPARVIRHLDASELQPGTTPLRQAIAPVSSATETA